MPDVTIEDLAKRVEELERKLAALAAAPPPDAWKAVVGIFEDNEFTRDMIAETLAIRERSRQADGRDGTMILFDSDHLTVLEMPDSDRRRTLLARVALATEPLSVPIIAAEEGLKWWLASINKEKLVLRQPKPYRELARLIRFFASFPLVDFTDPAAAKFEELRKAKVRIGTQDLKIASIALVNDALLLTANRQDFEQVPGLRFENWLDDPSS